MNLRIILIGTFIFLLSACSNQEIKPQETIVVKASNIDHEKALLDAIVEVDMAEFGFRGY